VRVHRGSVELSVKTFPGYDHREPVVGCTTGAALRVLRAVRAWPLEHRALWAGLALFLGHVGPGRTRCVPGPRMCFGPVL
jgi:hypothetical protein